MWITFALASAFFAGLVAILAKIGIRSTPSNLATGIRTLVVLVLAWAMVWITGALESLASVSMNTLVLLTLSGLATGASWLFFFRALQVGPVNPVVAVDKSSIVLTIFAGIIVFGETENLIIRLFGIVAIGVGTYLMVQWQPVESKGESTRQWLPFALLAAVFGSITTLLAKVGMEEIDATLGTAIRTIVVLLMAWVVVFLTGEQRQLARINRRDLLFLILSGLATGASWLCFFRALQAGPVSAVVPIDKLSVLVTVAFSFLVFKEKLTRGGAVGLILLVGGTLLMLIQ